MPAHLRPIVILKCQHPSGCHRNATVSLYNTWNELFAHYCDSHGGMALVRVRKMEAEAQQDDRKGESLA